MSGPALRVDPAEVVTLHVAPDDPRARVLFDDLEREYDSRYGHFGGDTAAAELNRYPVAYFQPPDGAFLLLQVDGEVIAGGAFMRLDAETAEFKRIWTHPDHRRRGLSRLVLVELEAEAVRRGYRRVYLTTGPLQPEAQALYASSGYTVLPLVGIDDRFFIHPFEKTLPEPAQERP